MTGSICKIIHHHLSVGQGKGEARLLDAILLYYMTWIVQQLNVNHMSYTTATWNMEKL